MRNSTTDRREKSRVDRQMTVRASLIHSTLSGESANTSAEGVYFLAKGPLLVDVTLTSADGERTVRGELVRVDSRSQGQLGVAIRMTEPLVDLGK